MNVLTRRHAPAALTFLVAFALSSAKVPAAAGAPADPRAAHLAAVQRFLDGFIEALNTADVKNLTSFFAPNATVFFPLASLPLRLEDKGQITAAFGAFFEGIRSREQGPRYMSLTPEDVRVQFAGDVAVVTFHLKGEQMISRRTLVLQRRSDAWLVVHLHASNLPTQKQ
jgi:ketosteroid isomerase-like protein